jgi:Tol biopolymer transport system component
MTPIIFVLSMLSCKTSRSLRAELNEQEHQNGLKIASYYRGVETITFSSRSASHRKEISPNALEGTLSSDGTEVAVLHDDPKQGSSLAVSRLDGSDLRRYPEIAVPYDLCWSYDKLKLAMSIQNLRRGTTPPNDSLVIFDLTSRIIQDIDSRAHVTSQCWSPDNKQVVYDADDSIRVYSADHRTWQVLAKGHDATWSPDGNWIAFLDNDTYYAIRLSGEDRKLLFGTKGALSPAW